MLEVGLAEIVGSERRIKSATTRASVIARGELARRRRAVPHRRAASRAGLAAIGFCRSANVVAAGHRVVHGGVLYRRTRDRDRRRCSANAAGAWCRWRRCTSRTTSPASWRHAKPGRMCRMSPASTPPFTARIRSSTTCSRCRAASTMRACGAMASTGCPTNTSSAACARSRRCTPPGGWWSRISATAPRCARSATGSRWRVRWASPRSTACRWARAAASSIPASCST